MHLCEYYALRRNHKRSQCASVVVIEPSESQTSARIHVELNSLSSLALLALNNPLLINRVGAKASNLLALALKENLGAISKAERVVGGDELALGGNGKVGGASLAAVGLGNVEGEGGVGVLVDLAEVAVCAVDLEEVGVLVVGGEVEGAGGGAGGVERHDGGGVGGYSGGGGFAGGAGDGGGRRGLGGRADSRGGGRGLGGCGGGSGLGGGGSESDSLGGGGDDDS